MSIPKKIFTLKNSTNEVRDVLDDFNNSVVSTLGPLGKTVIIESEDIIPHVTKDGVTVSEAIYYKDKLKNSLAALLKEAARKTAQKVGDGTTTSILMASQLINETLDYQVLNTNVRNYLEGVDKAVDFVIEYLEEEIQEVEMGSEELKGVIKISSNSDLEITEMLSNLTDSVGAHGIIDVKLADSNTTEVLVREGASIDSKVVAKPSDKAMEVDEDTFIVLIEGPVHDVPDIKEVLSILARAKSPAIIVAKEFSDSVIKVVNVNNSNSSLRVILVNAEGFGNSRLEILKDLSVVTDATILSTQGATAISLRDFTPDHFGISNGFVATDREVILHCLEINLELESTMVRKSALIKDYEENTDLAMINVYKRRLAKYVKVATILVGGTTQASARETKDRIDDAVAAVSAAVNGGVLPGGGASLIRATKILEVRKDSFKEGAEDWGRKAVIQMCEAPLRKLVSNAGFEFDEDIIMTLKTGTSEAFDVILRKVVDAYSYGILDPALVLIEALTNATAVNRSICNSSSFIIFDYEI